MVECAVNSADERRVSDGNPDGGQPFQDLRLEEAPRQIGIVPRTDDSEDAPTALAAVQRAIDYLEAVEPLEALTVLREACLEANDPAAVQRNRYIKQAITEIETHYPGHALGTLRLAIGRARLG